MAESRVRAYGACPCSGQYGPRKVEVRMTVAGRVLVLPDVPQGGCPLCGSRVYKADILEAVEGVMKQAAYDRRCNELPR